MTNEWTIPSVPLSKKEKLIVGVSGGSDSLGLLFILLDRLPEAQGRLVVAHVNYGLRGEASNRDEEKVRRICRDLNLPFKKLRVRGFKSRVLREKRSAQDWARHIRYSFFQKLVREQKAWGAAVAHHLEDQAETVLDRLLRGAGPRGLSGLRPIQSVSFDPKFPPLKIWRPLLGFSKGRIQSFLTSQNIQWREDKSNQENNYRRNQIRNKIFPFLSRWNPKFTEVLARVGEITAAEDIFMEEQLAPLEKKMNGRWGKGDYACQASVFAKAPIALQRRWIRRVAGRLNPQARGLSFERIEEVIRLWKGLEPGPKDLGFGLTGGRTLGRAFLRWKGRKTP